MFSLFLKGGFFGKSSLFTRILLRFFSFFLIYLFVVLFFSCSCGKAAKDPNANNLGSGGGNSGSSSDTGDGSDTGGQLTPGWGKAPDPPWTPRSLFEAVVFKDKIWVLGGLSDDAIWNTSDGTNWTQVTPVGPVWAPRTFSQAEVFDEKIWVIGGSGDDNDGKDVDYDDIWNTSDGVNWHKVTPTGWPTGNAFGVTQHQTVVHDNKLWLLGKFFDNDILQSSNGTNWTKVTVNGTQWSSRFHHGAAVFDNKMWVVGGDTGTTVLKDVWSSADGINWTEHTVTTVANADGTTPVWKVRKSFEMLPFNNELLIFAGRSDNTGSGVDYKDIWSTTNGADWKEVSADVPWLARTGFRVVEFKGSLWLLGGHDDTTTSLKSVWRFVPTPSN